MFTAKVIAIKIKTIVIVETFKRNLFLSFWIWTEPITVFKSKQKRAKLPSLCIRTTISSSWASSSWCSKMWMLEIMMNTIHKTILQLISTKQRPPYCVCPLKTRIVKTIRATRITNSTHLEIISETTQWSLVLTSPTISTIKTTIQMSFHFLNILCSSSDISFSLSTSSWDFSLFEDWEGESPNLAGLMTSWFPLRRV